jgi:pimeloyl-ACP methyl ester carboxylesterase
MLDLTRMAAITVQAGGVTLAGDEDGEGAPVVVLLHGLTATRRYVVMGSRALERGGHRVIAYDARGHGASSPAPEPAAYRYEDLASDLLAVLDARDVDRAVLAGASMGAHTIVRFALDHGDRVAGLVAITPAFDPDDTQDEERRLARWDALSKGLRQGGVEGFVDAFGVPNVPERWHDTVYKVLRQRLGAHEHPEAVADALRAVPRSRPFESWDELAEIDLPVAVVASRDEADPEHPFAVGERYAEALPRATLHTEEPGSSPMAWQGSQLSRVIAEIAERV